MFRRMMVGAALAATLLLATRATAADAHFDSDGVKIHYVIEGEGEPVILVHGYTANIQAQWGNPRILQKLAENYRVIALDNRGHGQSDKPHDVESYGPEMANDVIRLMDHLKLDKAHVVGYSMGAFITSYLVNNFPDRVITATLGGAGWAKADDQEGNSFVMALAESLEEGKGVGPLIDRLTPEGQPKPDAQQIEFVNRMILSSNDPKALAACIRGLLKLTVTEKQLRANRVPTLALIGSIDPLKRGVDEMDGVMSNLRIVVIPGADHMTAFTRARFIEELKGFLAAEHGAATAAGGN